MPLSPGGSQGRLLLFQAIQSILQKAWKEKWNFSLCAFPFPGPVSRGKAALWLYGQAQGRDTVCVQNSVSALALARQRGSILWLFFTWSRLKRASVDAGDGASVDCP